MVTNDPVTTDKFIKTINRFPKVYAARNSTYGICIYPDYESYQRDKKNWFMTIDTKATSIAQPFGTNFCGWPQQWEDEDYWGTTETDALELSDYLREMISDLIDQYIATPVFSRDETLISSVVKEALLHQLKGTVNNEKLNEDSQQAVLKYADGVFNTLGLKRDYEATVKPKGVTEIVLPS